MKALAKNWLRMLADRRGLAATEFAFIMPVMLVMFFGTVEFSSGVAVDRKVTLMARTLSDLTSQSTSVTDADIANFFLASNWIMWPYSTSAPNPNPVAPLSGTITELYVDPTTLQARVQWSKGTAPRTTSAVVAIPSALAVAGTYLIYSEVSYNYVPTVGYVMAKAGITLSDFAYTRPRQSTCVLLNATTGSCPTS
ncbi:TadE/TadG family type IV pilus assembly protein [Bradyrhizobium sp.]|uniref:TadE/TadG family type IV pilus assembly protein n=1 Tax=Bradyrhizobium sp. TaxID=376 RepID=UPI001D7B68AC|nr:TadE/TadG family type IV pilus assembly protein [Bradyrhizobium sp.]MBV8698247.1 pilus assembly protein [Bradyrhizobium sp.]MBV8918005.1 pilus assembly protein [Bradyrhizobium sp.]MBV9982309.1 pilus assembly protein [Bradyrhizobium sp.]